MGRGAGAGLALVAAVAAGCGGEGGRPAPAAAGYLTVRELFVSEEYPADNLDSLASWPPGPWVVATAKSTDQLLVLDARDGRLLRRVGERGEAPGQLRRPNGVAVAGDVLFVTERDNRRVQLFRLPAFSPLGFVGARILHRPYGLAVVAAGEGEYHLYVTDNYEGPGPAPLPPAQLGERVKHFRVRVDAGGVREELVRAFGATGGEGVLTTVESIAADPLYDRLLIADETEGAYNIKVYTLGGEFTGQVLGQGLFGHEPEGIALVPLGDGDGLWVATDQRRERTVFHLFQRRDLRHLGSLQGEVTANTDGIAAEVEPVVGEARLYAVHDDRAVVAFSLPALLRAVGVARP